MHGNYIYMMVVHGCIFRWKTIKVCIIHLLLSHWYYLHGLHIVPLHPFLATPKGRPPKPHLVRLQLQLRYASTATARSNYFEWLSACRRLLPEGPDRQSEGVELESLIILQENKVYIPNSTGRTSLLTAKVTQANTKTSLDQACNDLTKISTAQTKRKQSSTKSPITSLTNQPRTKRQAKDLAKISKNKN